MNGLFSVSLSVDRHVWRVRDSIDKQSPRNMSVVCTYTWTYRWHMAKWIKRRGRKEEEKKKTFIAITTIVSGKLERKSRSKQGDIDRLKGVEKNQPASRDKQTHRTQCMEKTEEEEDEEEEGKKRGKRGKSYEGAHPDAPRAWCISSVFNRPSTSESNTLKIISN